MRAKVTWGLSIACVALAGGGGYLLHRLDSEQELTDSERMARHSAESRLKDLQAQYAALQESYVSLRIKGDESPATEDKRGGASAGRSASTNPRTPNNSPNNSIASQEASGTMARERMRPMGPRQNTNIDMVRSLKLNDADAERLLQVLTEDQDKFRQALAASGGNPDAQAMAAARSESDQHVRDLLGDAKYQEFQDYREYQQEHQRISQLNARLANSGTVALSDAQQQNLFVVLKEEKNRVAVPTPAQFSSTSEFVNAYDQWREAYNTRTMARAATILTPEQLARLPSPREFPFRGPPPGR
jgi:hypothetical protein